MSLAEDEGVTREAVEDKESVPRAFWGFKHGATSPGLTDDLYRKIWDVLEKPVTLEPVDVLPSSGTSAIPEGAFERLGFDEVSYQFERTGTAILYIGETWTAGVEDEGGTSQTADEPLYLGNFFSTAVDELFQDAEGMEFETGIESEFQRSLEVLISKLGMDLFALLEAKLDAAAVRHETLEEMLRFIGRTDEPKIHSFRLSLLAKGLGHPSRFVRDAAALGLAHLGDQRAEPHLRRAIAVEQVPELRADFQEVLQDILGSRTEP